MITRLILFLSAVLTFFPPGNIARAAEDTDKFYEVIIVGGGIAGLTAAFYLDEYDILVLEKENQVGGRASNGHYQGIPFARGTEYLGMPEFPLKEIIDTLAIPMREIPAPADITFHDNKMYIGENGRAALLVAKSSIREYNRFATKILDLYEEYEDLPDLDLSGELGRLDTMTASQWFKENGFSPIYGEFYNVTFRGLFGANLDELSALSVLAELAFDFEGFEAIEEDADLAEELAYGIDSTGMYTCDGGIADIPMALARHLGDKVRTGQNVTHIQRQGTLFEITTLIAENTTKKYLAESVVLATPAPVTLKIAEDALSDEQRRLLDSIHYAPYATIALFSSQPVFNSGFDLAVPDGFLFTDIYDATWVRRHTAGKQDTQQNWISLIYAARNPPVMKRLRQ